MWELGGCQVSVDKRLIVSLGVSFVLVSINNTIFWTIFRVFIYSIGGSFTEVALVSALQNLFSILLSPLWGALSDELRRRKPFIVFGSASIALFTPLFTIAKDVFEYLIIFTAASFFSSMIYPAINAYLSEVVESEYRGRSLGYFLGFNAIGWTLGGFLSGYIAEYLGMGNVFIFAGIIGIAGAILAQIFIREVSYETRGERNIVRKAWSRVISMLHIRRSPDLNTLLAVIMLYGIGSGIFFTIFQIKFFESVGRSFLLYGLVSGLSGLGSIVAPPLYGYLADKIGKKTVFQATLICYTAYFIILGLVWNPAILAILWLLPLWPGVRISSIAIAADISEEESMGEYQGFVSSSSAISRTIGALLGGIIADLFNARTSLYIMDYILIGSSIGPLSAALAINKLKIEKR